MNKSYINQGDKVLIFNDKGEGKYKTNNNNIDEILRLENYKSLLQSELEIRNRRNDILVKEQTVSTGIQVGFGITYLGFKLWFDDSLKNINLNFIDPRLIFMSAMSDLLFATTLIGIPIVWKYEVKKEIKENDLKFTKLEFFDYAIDKAMQINKDKSKEIVKVSDTIHYLKDPSLDIIKYYYANHDMLKEKYNKHSFIKDTNHDNLDNSLFGFMMEKEIEDENQSKIKNLTKMS